MKVRSFLLPHRWQVAGWGMLVGSVLAFIITLVIIELNLEHEMFSSPDTLMKLLFSAYCILAGLALLLIAFSKEKKEDEFIMSLRGRSLAITAVAAFTVSVLWLVIRMVGGLYVRLEPFDTVWWIVSYVDRLLTLIPFFFLYVVVFKAHLWIYRWRSSHEE